LSGRENLHRAIVAAHDSPGAWIKRDGFMVHVSRKPVSAGLLQKVIEVMKGGSEQP